MFPKEIVEILQKYQNNSENELMTINKDVQSIISQLKHICSYLSHNIQELIDTGIIHDKEDELLQDTKTLRNYINSIELLNICDDKADNNEEISEEISPILFDKKVYLWLVSDDICPFCNTKFMQHTIFYQRIINNKINDETVSWYKCKSCNRLFALDFDIEDFELENTNILLNKDKYDEIPQIDIYSVIVLSNTLKCSANHKTKDLLAKIPVLDEDGTISYLKINASYCFDCDRFTILKEDFIAIKDIIIGKVIDETYTYQNNSDNTFEIEQSKSVLAQYGYNVQTKKDLSVQQRQIILSSLIEAHIMERRDVINHINTLIERGSKIPTWKMATQKWKEDKQFVSNYKSDTLPDVIFNNIILKYKRSKSL